MNRLRWPSFLIVAATIAGPARAAAAAPNSWPLSSNEEAWKFLPATLVGGGARLPTWARATARDLPRTTAAMLDLDRLHRTNNPLGPSLRGKMRWVAADANHCEYAKTPGYKAKDQAKDSKTEVPQNYSLRPKPQNINDLVENTPDQMLPIRDVQRMYESWTELFAAALMRAVASVYASTAAAIERKYGLQPAYAGNGRQGQMYNASQYSQEGKAKPAYGAAESKSYSMKR
jgi:hypothetical protein